MIDKINLKALFILFALVSFVVVAQEDSSENNEEADDDNIEEVITLGSRIARNPLELAQPVTIISGEEYAKRASGYQSSFLPRVGNTRADDYRNCTQQKYYRDKDQHDFCAWHAGIGKYQ